MKLPAYGKEFREARKAGRYVNPWLYCGRRAFELAARRGPGRLVLPEGADPAGFDWRVVSGCDVVVRWPAASTAETDALGAALVRCGARSVHVLPDLSGDVLSGPTDTLRPYRRFMPRRAAA